MAYRRKQGVARSSTFKEDIHPPPPLNNLNSSSSFNSSTPSLAAQAIRASAYEQSRSKNFNAYEDESKGFWGILADKAKSVLEDDNVSQFGARSYTDGSIDPMYQQVYESNNVSRKNDNPNFRRGLDKITTSLNQMGDSFERAYEEGRTIVENKTADIIHETRKFQSRQQGTNEGARNQSLTQATYLDQAKYESQLKKSREVALATAAKAKQLLRELKTVKADLAFARERCSQLEEENKRLRESREKGSNPEDDDLIRLQLETLLAEKTRLAHENEIYARENRFLREIVEYHQLTMQDVVQIDEGTEEVYPSSSITNEFFETPASPVSCPSTTSQSPQSTSSPEHFLDPEQDQLQESKTDSPTTRSVQESKSDTLTTHSVHESKNNIPSIQSKATDAKRP